MAFKDINSSIFSTFGKYLSLKKYLLVLITILFLFFLYSFLNDKFLQNESFKSENTNRSIAKANFSNLKSYFLEKYQSPYQQYKYIIQNNDSIEKILLKYDIKYSEIKSIVQDLKEKKLSNIYAGREMEIVTKKNIDEKSSLINIFYPVSNTLFVQIRKAPEGFEVKKNIIKLTKKEVILKNTIQNNLYSSAIRAGIEPNIIIEFARIFGFEVDFQRDIRKEDWFEIYYERFIDDKGEIKDTGKIIYASMFVNNEEISLYNFKHKDESGYYDVSGKSIVKALMKTPINGARLSSSFGKRKHPILGFNKQHNGTDFAAPKGTPIMASGNGKVIRARWCGGGGNCVKIRHNSSYSTVYAHLSKFATREGRRVKQGEIIGFVGSTGMSTGPHLHYEVHYNGKPINSQKLKLPSGKILKGSERKEFEIERIKIDLKLSELRNN
tara:strand:- start:511 stop:1827 length:1317 start_codon:yes stop_codon:yes gene_type:complete